MAEKKKFFEVELPLINEKVKLISYDIEQLNNRNIKQDMTRFLRGKSLEVVFRVKVNGGKAVGEPIKISLLPYFIRRMMRKSVSYVEDSFSAECHNAVLRIKPFLITRKKVTREVRKALREATKKYLEEYAKEKDLNEIFSDITGSNLQKSLSLKLKKIYPLALCEIREIAVESLKEGTPVEKIVDKKPKAEATEEVAE